jgi:hypothetical protein
MLAACGFFFFTLALSPCRWWPSRHAPLNFPLCVLVAAAQRCGQPCAAGHATRFVCSVSQLGRIGINALFARFFPY